MVEAFVILGEIILKLLEDRRNADPEFKVKTELIIGTMATAKTDEERANAARALSDLLAADTS